MPSEDDTHGRSILPQGGAGGRGGERGMKKILETMYILTPDSYLYHRNENICVSIAGQEKASVPAKDVDSIVFFGKNTLSTSLLSFCGEREITLTFLDPNGRLPQRRQLYSLWKTVEQQKSFAAPWKDGKICRSSGKALSRRRTDGGIC